MPVRRRLPAAPLALAAVVLMAGACSPLANLPLPSLSGGGSSPAVQAPGTSVAPTASSEPSPSGGGPAPTSAAQQALAVMDAAKAWAAEDGRSYKVTYAGKMRYATGIIAVKGSLIVDGADASSRTRFAIPGGAETVEYRRVGGSDWFRPAGASWRSVKGIPAADMVDPLRGLRDGSRVTWLGPVEGEDGHYTIQTSGYYLHPVLIPAARVTDERIKSAKLTLVVREDGRPVRATWNLKGNLRVQGTQVQGVAFDLELAYGGFGDAFEIEKP